MSSVRKTDDELRESLKNRAIRLNRIVDTTSPQLLAVEIALIVTAARLLVGRELIDLKIEEHQRIIDVQEVGICAFCQNAPALTGEACCEQCILEFKKEVASDDFNNFSGGNLQ